MTEISKEWCINMAKQEEGDIGAGKLAIDPTADNFHNLPLSESFERVAKVAKERDAFNEAMALREVLMAVTQDDRNAAASLYLKTEGEPSSLHDKATAAEIETGVHDDWDCVQAFARHRQYGYDQGYYDGRQADGAEERAKIVAWLAREEEDYPSGKYSGFAAIIREEIEAGEHLK
jgi:hypothetical protein